MTGIIFFLYSAPCKMAESEFSSPSTTSRGDFLHATGVGLQYGDLFFKTGCTKTYIYDETTGKKVSNESVSLLKLYMDKYM
jgi:hypothetical protein